MIQSYSLICENINLINNKLNKKTQIQKIFSTSYFICLSLRTVGESFNVFIGRGKGYEGVWVSSIKPNPIIRIHEKFLQFLRKNLKNTFIKKISMDNQDRIVSIETLNEKIMFFWRGRELLFYFNNEELQFCSWKGKFETKDDASFEVFNEVGRKNIPKTKKKENIDIKVLLDKEVDLLKNLNKSSKISKKKNTKIKRIENDLQNLHSMYQLKDDLINNKLDLSTYEGKTKINGVKFNFLHCKNDYQKRDLIFSKIKRIQDVIPEMEKRLEEIKKPSKQTYDKKLKVVMPFWRIEKEKSSNKKKALNFSVKSFDGYKIGYGLSSQGNDQLRKEFASKEDWWFHVMPQASAHIIVKGWDTIDMEKLNIVCDFYSKLINKDEFDIIYTRVKYLNPVKGSPGMVRYKKEKSFRYIK